MIFPQHRQAFSQNLLIDYKAYVFDVNCVISPDGSLDLDLLHLISCANAHGNWIVFISQQPAEDHEELTNFLKTFPRLDLVLVYFNNGHQEGQFDATRGFWVQEIGVDIRPEDHTNVFSTGSVLTHFCEIHQISIDEVFKMGDQPQPGGNDFDLLSTPGSFTSGDPNPYCTFPVSLKSAFGEELHGVEATKKALDLALTSRNYT